MHLITHSVPNAISEFLVIANHSPLPLSTQCEVANMMRISVKNFTIRPVSLQKQKIVSLKSYSRNRSNQNNRNTYGNRSFFTVPIRLPRQVTFAIPGISAGNTLIGLGLGFLAYSLLGDSDEPEASEAADASLAQSTVVTGNHPQGAFVVITLSPSADLKEVAKACANLPTIVKNISEDSGKSNVLSPLMAGVAFGTQTWEKICQQTKQGLPSNFGHFTARAPGKYGGMPATGGDILLHVKAETQSMLFETVKEFVDQLPSGSVAKVEDRYGFQFQDGRDLSGFIDGTENPSEAVSRRAAALLPTGGSYVIHQKWIHNLKKFHSLPEEQQEQKIGREKPDSAALEPLPPASHVARTRDEKGQKIPIVRQSMPFGAVGGEHGLLFIAYSNTPSKFDVMLDRMVGKGGPTDEVMFFSTCAASQYFYCPSVSELEKLGN
mmetsp:Transcript_808/g.1119  ORF Transcript_808/g.1119 Transcript_808/m.1119 type:complete len:436 (+) Transcript_808:624-1931(+)